MEERRCRSGGVPDEYKGPPPDGGRYSDELRSVCGRGDMPLEVVSMEYSGDWCSEGAPFSTLASVSARQKDEDDEQEKTNVHEAHTHRHRYTHS